MTRPRVSILTPTFNHEWFIGSCIESVLSQTRSDWEMLVLDDGSVDRTYEIAMSFGDERVKVFRQDNQGIIALAANYNRLLAEANGDLVAILEGDDYWPPGRLERQVSQFDEAEVVLASGITSIVDEKGSEIGSAPARVPPESAAGNEPVGSASIYMLDPEVLTFTFPVSTMMRKGALESVGGFQQPRYLPVIDFPTFLKLGKVGAFRFDEAVLGYWRRHGDSTTSGRLSDILDGAYRHALEFMRSDPEGADRAAEYDRLQVRWDAFQARRFLFLGRLLAHEGKWQDAQRAFRVAASYPGGRKARLGGRIALLLSRLRVSPEALFRAAGHPDWRDGARIGGDWMVSRSMLERPERHTWRLS